MQKRVILNLVGAGALMLLCSCGQSNEQKEVAPQEHVEEVEQQEVLAVEMPEAMTDIQQEAFAEFPEDDETQNDCDDNDDMMDDQKA